MELVPEASCNDNVPAKDRMDVNATAGTRMRHGKIVVVFSEEFAGNDDREERDVGRLRRIVNDLRTRQAVHANPIYARIYVYLINGGNICNC